jgi:methyltransferase (TIGR00027 family)
MEDPTASRTALRTALMRGVHSRFDPLRLLDDRWGEQMIPQAVKDEVEARALAAMSENDIATAKRSPLGVLGTWLRSSPAYPAIITRSRYAEDALIAAISASVHQYVIIGAGFDTFALRRPVAAHNVAVIEIDHPATQLAKRRFLADSRIAPPDNLHFVDADLTKDSLSSVLKRSPYMSDAPAFVSWLGVTMYLSREANMATLNSIANSSSVGSELVFTYFNQSTFEVAPIRQTTRRRD